VNRHNALPMIANDLTSPRPVFRYTAVSRSDYLEGSQEGSHASSRRTADRTPSSLAEMRVRGRPPHQGLQHNGLSGRAQVDVQGRSDGRRDAAGRAVENIFFTLRRHAERALLEAAKAMGWLPTVTTADMNRRPAAAAAPASRLEQFLERSRRRAVGETAYWRKKRAADAK
jgi:hypothetical protein